MKANLVVEEKVVLTLDKESAILLKGIMQNPLWGEHPAVEDAAVKELRHSLFQELRNVLGDL